MDRHVPTVGTAQAPQPCPECKGTGSGALGRSCWACEGFGSMTRTQASHYYGEGGTQDAEEDRAYLERRRDGGPA